MDLLHAPLQGLLEGVVHPPEQFRDEHLTNFGRLHRWTPRFVVEPRHEADVRAILRFAREQGLEVSTRGSAHSGRSCTDPSRPESAPDLRSR